MKGIRKNGIKLGFQKGHTINKGKKASEETRIKLSIAGRGKKHWWGSKISAKLKGKKKSLEHRKKQSIAMMGKKATPEARKKMSENRRGDKNHNWKGGITLISRGVRQSFEMSIWRKAVLEIGGHKCLWCGSTENLEVDHIKPFILYPELRFAIDNGRILCKPCHKTTDTYAGKIRKLLVN